MTLRIPYLIAAAIAAVSVFYLASPPGLRAAPVLTVTSIAGAQLNLAATNGKARLVTFMSPDCAVTNKNLPAIDTIQQHYGDDKLEVVGITMPYDSEKGVDRFRADNNIQFQLVADTDGTIADAFVRVRFTPTSFLIDDQGNIIQRIVGRLQVGELKDKIDAMTTTQSLAQKSVEQ